MASSAASLSPRPDADGAPSIFSLTGFGAVFDKELLEARRSKRLLIFTAIMTGVVLLVPLIAYFRVEALDAAGRNRIGEDDMDALVATWAGLVGYLGALMVIASTIDAVSRERSTGITAWVLTKPVSRASYLLAKSIAHTVTGYATLVVVPMVVWLVVMLLLFERVPVGQAMLSAVILGVEVAFLSFFTVSLGVAFKSVPPIAVVALALFFAPTIAPSISALEWTFRVLPSYLPLAAIVVNEPELERSPLLTIPLSSIAVAAVMFVGMVAWFERQEL